MRDGTPTLNQKQNFNMQYGKKVHFKAIQNLKGLKLTHDPCWSRICQNIDKYTKQNSDTTYKKKYVPRQYMLLYIN